MLVALDLVSQCLFCSRRRPPITGVHCHTMEERSGGSHDKYLLTDLCDSFEGTLLPLSRSNVQTRLTVDTMLDPPQALAPYTTQCVGIDLSENMVGAYNTRAENQVSYSSSIACSSLSATETVVAQPPTDTLGSTRTTPQGLTEDEMHAYQGNLCVPSDPEPEALAAPTFFNFDIAAVGLGFHHFDDPALAAQRLVKRLNPGGVLLVLDFLTHDKLDHVSFQFPSRCVLLSSRRRSQLAAAPIDV